MEQLNDEILAVNGKIERFNNFIALSLRRDAISKELQQLLAQTECVQDLLTAAHNQMHLEHNKLVEETKEVMSRMRDEQAFLLEYLVREKHRQLREIEDNKRKICTNSLMKSALKSSTTIPQSAVKLVAFNLSQLHLDQSGFCITPKMKISEYKASPLVKKKVMPVPFQFTDFDVQITQQQFDRIPKYMCGRETLEQLNSFLETVIVATFNEKYQLIHKARNALRNNSDFDLWKMYNDQALYLPGKMFITPGDITRIVGKMLDKKAQNRIIILRHLGILQEQRVKQTVCLVWTHTGY